MSSISSGIDGSGSINTTISFEKVEIVVGELEGRMDQSGGAPSAVRRQSPHRASANRAA
jgi:hypothetical protein